MNFDFGEVLSRAWKITWKHKALWIIGILFGFFVSELIKRSLSFFWCILGLMLLFALGMMPFFTLPFSFMSQDINWIAVVSILCFIVFIPLFATLSGWSMIFTKSAWVLTYLRLTRSPQLQPLP